MLSESQEEELKKYIPDMDIAFYELTIMDIRMPVFEYYKRNKQMGPLFFMANLKLIRFIVLKIYLIKLKGASLCPRLC